MKENKKIQDTGFLNSITQHRFSDKERVQITVDSILQLWTEGINAKKIPLIKFTINDKKNNCKWELTIIINKEINNGKNK